MKATSGATLMAALSCCFGLPVAAVGKRAVSPMTEARLSQQAFARCVVKRNPQATRKFVLSQDAVEQQQAIKAIVIPDCVDSKGHDYFGLKMPGSLAQQAMAEALLERDIRQPVSDFLAVPPLRRRNVDQIIAAWKEVPKANPSKDEVTQRKYAEDIIYVEKLGECVVRSSPTNSYALTRAEIGSEDEVARINSSHTALESCVEQDASVTLNKSMLRGTVAFNYYLLLASLDEQAASGGIN